MSLSKLSLSLAFLAVSVSVGATAQADETSNEHASRAEQGREHAQIDLLLHEQEQPERRWYGYQIVLTDVSAVAISLAASDSSVFLGTYSLSGPLVHYAHGHKLRAAVDFGVRLAVPLATKLIVTHQCDARGPDASPQTIDIFDCEDEGNLAMVLPALAISLFDYAFSWDERAPQQRVTPGYGVGIAPRQGGVDLAFSGSF